MVLIGRGPSAVVQTSADDVRLPRPAAEACISECRPAAGASELIHAARPDYIAILTNQPPCLPSLSPLPSRPHPRPVVSHWGLDFLCISSALIHNSRRLYVDSTSTKYSIQKIAQFTVHFRRLSLSRLELSIFVNVSILSAVSDSLTSLSELFLCTVGIDRNSI